MRLVCIAAADKPTPSPVPPRSLPPLTHALVETTRLLDGDMAMAESIDKDFEYRKRLVVILPTLTQTDATLITRGWLLDYSSCCRCL